VRSRRELQKCRPFDSRFSKVLKMGLQIPDLRRFLSFARQGRHWVASGRSGDPSANCEIAPLSAILDISVSGECTVKPRFIIRFQ
jgi:hypothetical protein